MTRVNVGSFFWAANTLCSVLASFSPPAARHYVQVGIIGRDLDLRSLPHALDEDGPYQNAVVSMSCWEFLRSSLHEDKVLLASHAAGHVITIVKR